MNFSFDDWTIFQIEYLCSQKIYWREWTIWLRWWSNFKRTLRISMVTSDGWRVSSKTVQPVNLIFFHQTHFSLIQRKFNPLLLNKFDINLYNYSILELCKYSTVFLCKKTKIYYTKFIHFVKHKTLPNRITTNKKKKKLVFKQNWQNLQSTLTMRKIDFGNSLLLFNQRARIIFFQINISTNSYSK